MLMHRFKPFFKFLTCCMLGMFHTASADLTLNMTPGVTPISKAVYDLHMTVIWICVAIGIVVFGVMFYSIIFHRKSRGAVAAQFHESTTVEVIWTIIPFIILIAMAVPATRVLLDQEDPSDSDLTVKITGYMWRWHYSYLEQDLEFMSQLSTPFEQIANRAPKGKYYLLEVDNPLVLPINKKIRFLTTAHDVIHSWWVPAFAVKKDAIPGFINETWAYIEKPGTYRGQCAELCGARHGFMPIVVKAVPEDEFKDWMEKTRQSLKS
jgi:cytochrome c oxidase subunit II